MKKYYLFAGLVLLAASPAFAQTKIGAAGAPDASAMLEVTSGVSNNKGLLPPRVTTTQRDAITSPATGLMIYNTTTNQLQVNTGTPAAPIWVIATATNSGWDIVGNSGTNPATNFLGTTDSQPLAIRTNNTEKVRVTASGSVGIGTDAPGVKLQVVDTGDAAILVGTAAGSRGHIRLGNNNHGVMRDLTSSGGQANDVALYTSTGNAAGSSLYLVSNSVSTGSDSLPLNQFVLKNTGDIGIGTNTPARKLHVEGTARIATAIGTPTTITGRNADGDVGNVTLGAGLSLTGGTLTATAGGNNWGLTGNTGTTPATNFIGTTDNQPLIVRTNNTEKVHVTATGNVGIGTNTPAAKLHIFDTTDVAIRLSTTSGNRMGIELGSNWHGVARNLANSGGLANDVALYTSSGSTAATEGTLYLASNPTASDSIPLTQFALKKNGNIGIGTNVPITKLQVVDTGDAAIRIGNADGGRGHIQLGNDNHGLMRDLTSSGGLANDVALFTSTGAGAAAVGNLYLVSNPGSYGSDSLALGQFVLKNTGNVGIGITDPKVKLQVQGGLLLRNDVNIAHGNGTFLTWSTVRPGVGETELVNYRGTGSGGFRFYDVDPGASVDTAVYNTNDIAFIDVSGFYHNLSDKRVKTNISKVNDGLEKVMAMRPVSYDFHTGRTLKNGVVTFTAKDKPVKSIGFLAQELAQVVPEAVTVPKDANNELYSVTYTTLIPVLTKAIQEQQAQIEALKAKNEQLEASNKITAQLMERVKQMEQMMGINEIEGTSKVAGK